MRWPPKPAEAGSKADNGSVVITRRSVLLLPAAAALGAVGCTDPSAPGPAASSSAASAPPSEGAPGGESSTARPSRRSPSPQPSPEPSPTSPPRPGSVSTIVDDLDVPWGLVFLRSGDVLVSERNTARLLRITTRGRTRTVGEVRGVQPPGRFGEGGLLGLAVDPDDEERLFAYLSTDSDNRIVSMRLRGNRVSDQRNILTGIPRNVNHNGGQLLFGPDGLLYVSTGDAAQGELAQDRDSLAGKILRIRKDGRAARGNPFDNRVFSYGHRNIEGLAFDARGRLWATEFGERRTDELNLIRIGRNYGWPRVEGRSSRFTPPAVTWSPTSVCSPAGLAITRNTAFVAALRGQCLFSVRLNRTRAGRPRRHFGERFGRLRSVAVAPDGALWVTTSNTDGRGDPGPNDDKILRVEL
jgi:glucose/arabinose dehydrogenase